MSVYGKHELDAITDKDSHISENCCNGCYKSMVMNHSKNLPPRPLHPYPRKVREYGTHCSVEAKSMTDLLECPDIQL